MIPAALQIQITRLNTRLSKNPVNGLELTAAITIPLILIAMILALA